MIRVTYNEELFGDITSESVCFFEKEDKIVFEFLGGDEWVDTFLPLDKKDIIKIKKQVKNLTLEECGTLEIRFEKNPNDVMYAWWYIGEMPTKLNMDDYVDVTQIYKKMV